jgi:hypothetical protein
MRRVIQIGDHSPEPTGYRGFESKAAYQRHYSDPANYADEMESMAAYSREVEEERLAAARHFALECTKPSAVEYAALADRLADAAARLVAAGNTKNFAGLRSASIDFDEIATQLAFLNTGLRHAIQNTSTGSTRR